VRVLLTTSGSAGHFFPLVPFARACVAAGHEVRVAAQRSRAGIVEATGLVFVGFDDRPPAEFGPIMGSLARLSSEEANVRMVSEVFGRIDARTALPGLLETIEDWRPDIVVSESTEFAGALAAELGGIAHARVPVGLLTVEEWALRVTAAALDDVRAGAGLPADPGAQRLRAAPRLTSVPAGLDDVPAGWSSPVHRFGSTPAGPGEPLPDWWHGASDPLVYVTFGSVAGALTYFPSLYRATIDALAPLPIRLLVTTGNDCEPAELGPVPANVRVERWVAQDTVAHEAAAVVCHGGYGTTLGALGHGLPLVVMSLQSTDQFHNARRVAEVGAGIALTDGPDSERLALDDPGPEVISALPDAVRNVLDDPGYRAAARGVAAEMAALPPLEEAVERLEALAVITVS
jgi:UDP:flavonoid glycosyltransferase YjiC (YdhE family)